MRTIPGETGHSGNRKKLESLYLKSITSAKEAKKREDHVLAESYYQRAEYYLHAMNEPSDYLHASISLPDPQLVARKVSAINKVIEDFNLKGSHEKLPSKSPNTSTEASKPTYQTNILPFKAHHNQQDFHYTQEVPE
ncbi:MAG: hypothetical protein K0R76_155 [Alphaproteobacteria bacterium]|nr:hypothetical protein [Alphaproteobacteria bacterium]MDF3033201.1 hypothetical protein [Alphaproteobacteria bacterium]